VTKAIAVVDYFVKLKYVHWDMLWTILSLMNKKILQHFPISSGRMSIAPFKTTLSELSMML
jgi:hypothetical protein